jgi:hypothetical protein
MDSELHCIALQGQRAAAHPRNVFMRNVEVGQAKEAC